MINRAGSWGTVQELRVSEPKEKFDGVPLVGVYPVPTRYSYWLGDTNQIQLLCHTLFLQVIMKMINGLYCGLIQILLMFFQKYCNC